MKLSALVGIAVVAVVVSIWVILFRSSDERPDIMPSFVGCYISDTDGGVQKMTVTNSGILTYESQTTSVVPYEDKQSLSLLPSLKVIIVQGGRIQFTAGNPMLLRIDADKQGFVVPSEDAEPVRFRRSAC